MQRKNRNSVLVDSGFGVREQQFMVWPSIGVKVRECRYNEAVEFLYSINASDVFFDGELVIIPKNDLDIIKIISEKFQATACYFCSYDDEYKAIFGDEFATKAIKREVDPELIILGNAISGLAGSADEMVHEALCKPQAALIRWKELYDASMNIQ